MRKVTLQEFVSADGFAADAGDKVDYVPASMSGDKSFGDRQLDFIDSVDTMLLGRVTYEMFAAYWPNVKSGDDKTFADNLNAMPKVVFSSTLGRAPWGEWDNARIVRTSAADEVKKLRQQPGKDMVLWGSISLAQSLMDAGQVDEYQLIICPIVLGRGRQMFRNPLQMQLLKSRSFDRGAVLVAYRSN